MLGDLISMGGNQTPVRTQDRLPAGCHYEVQLQDHLLLSRVDRTCEQDRDGPRELKACSGSVAPHGSED